MSTTYESLGIIDFDHLEFAVANLENVGAIYRRLGFEHAGSRKIRERKLTSHLYVQNQIRVMLSQSDDPQDPVGRFVATHGDGIVNVGFRCKDAISAFELAVNRGAEPLGSPKTSTRDFGSVTTGTIRTFGSVLHTFVSRDGSLFAEGFEEPLKTQNRGFGLERIDHLTCNVEQGQMDRWTAFYEKVFGLKNTRFFDIHTEKTGLYSKVMQSPDGVIKMPFNEPTDPKSQIQEFIDVLHGPGIQHAALITNEILSTIRPLKEGGVQFHETPHTYYEMIPQRLKGVAIKEDLGELEEAGIQVDGDPKGYLLQVFTQNVVGPFFYEVIERKGNDGFGEGNFRALFEAIERDQIRRGVLN